MWNFEIRNIGGIRSAEATVDSGLNVVQASNFMGKSSFMSAIQTIMGTSGMYGESHPLTEGASEGSTRLETADDTHEVRLERSETNAVVRHGTPYLDDEADQLCARLFAFLGERNPIRARVRNDEDLTALLQAPLDLEDIDAKIAERKRSRESKTTQLEAAEQAERNIPAVTEAIETLEADLEALREQRTELTARDEAAGGDGETLSDELADRRSSLATAEQTVSRLQDQIARTEDRLDETEAELAALDLPAEPEVTADIEAKEARIEECELRIDLLESLHRANQRVVEEDEVDLVASVDRTVVGDEFDCWVCGERTTAEDIERRLAALQETLQSLREERSTLTEELEQIEQRQRQYREKQREQRRLEETVGRLTAELDELNGDLTQAESRKAELEEAVADLEAQVAAAEEQVNEELTDVKAEIRTKEQELEAQRDRLSELEAKSEQAASLRAEIESLSTEITELRNRKTEKQWEIKEQFETAMGAAIDRFAPGFDGARLDVKTTPDNEIEAFDLVVARDGRETDIDTLSEGERELVGIVVAVAGYRTFDVAERVPLILLDGISQLSADNLQSLTEYLADASDVLVTTAYPEAGSFGGNRISPSQWDTVSDGEVSTA